MYLKLLFLTIIILAIAIAAIAVKMFFKKGGEFKKQCSSVDPETGKKLGCSCEGAPGDGSCRKEEEYLKKEEVSPFVSQIEALKID